MNNSVATVELKKNRSSENEECKPGQADRSQEFKGFLGKSTPPQTHHTKPHPIPHTRTSKQSTWENRKREKRNQLILNAFWSGYLQKEQILHSDTSRLASRNHYDKKKESGVFWSPDKRCTVLLLFLCMYNKSPVSSQPLNSEMFAFYRALACDYDVWI